MRTKKLSQSASWLFGLILAGALCTTALPVQAQVREVSGDYTIQVVEPPQYTTALWYMFMNNSGMLNMQYFFEPPVGVSQGHSAVLENGVWKIVDIPDSQWTGLSNPTDSGRVGLVYADSSGNWHNAIYHRGKITPLPDYTGQPAYQYGLQLISDHGLMAGIAFDPAVDIEPDGSIHYHGLVFNEKLSLFKVFDPEGSASTMPFGCNDSGVMVGQYLEWTGPGTWDGLYRAFLTRDQKTFINLNPPGGLGSAAVCINNRGEICGNYSDDPSNPNGWQAPGTHAYLLRKGTFSLFTIKGSSWTSLDWITDSGRLAGVYSDQNGQPHGFIATPKSGGK